MSRTNWQSIVESTQVVLENTCADLLNTELKYAENLIQADNLAASVYDGTYFIRLNGVSSVGDTVNTRFSPVYNVSIEICYQLSSGNSVEDYNNAMEDIEVIIRERLKQSSWTDYTDNIQYVRINNIGEPKTILKGEIFLIVPVNLEFTLISTY